MSTVKSFGGAAAATTLSSGISSSATTFTVADASSWPSSGSMNVVIDRGLVGEEKILATRSGNTFTVVGSRGYDGTSAAAHSTGAVVEHCLTAVDQQEDNDHINATTGHGATGAVVGTTNSQTLTNKTLTTPTIGDFTNAQHTHASAAQGGGFTLPSVRAYRTTAQSVPGTLTALTWNLESFDTDGFHSTSSNTERLTVPAGLGGLYLINVTATFNAATASGAAILELRLNGSTSTIIGFAEEYYTTAQDVTLSIATTYRLSAGDYVDAALLHGQAGSLNANGAGSNFLAPAFEMVRLGG